MGTRTDYEIECRCGVFVPLMQQGDVPGEGRFYYVHPDRLAQARCRHIEKFNPDVDNLDDLKALHPSIVVRGASLKDDPAPVEPKDEGEGGEGGFSISW